MDNERNRIIIASEMEPAVDLAAKELADAGEENTFEFIQAKNSILLSHYAKAMYQKGYIFSAEAKLTRLLINQTGEVAERAKEILRYEGGDTKSETQEIKGQIQRRRL